MKFERSHLKQAWVDWLSELIWEEFITFGFNHKIQAKRAFILVNNFFDEFLKTSVFRRIKFCAVHIFSISSEGTYHVHSLLISDHSFPYHFGNLKLGDPYNPQLRIEKAWRQKHGDCDAKLTIEGTNEELCGYIADCNIYPYVPDRWEIGYYRLPLVERLRNRNKANS